jgi:flagellar basal-body rod protein FlgB
MTTGPSQLGLLSQLLDATEMRHRVISQNIANVNTPGYQARVVEFEAALSQRLTGGGETESVKPQIEFETGLVARSDGNNVDIDRESGRLHQNALLYQTYSQMLASYFDSMRRAIETG